MTVKTKTKKVYDFKMPPVKNQLVKVLKKRKNAASIADLINDSGLPKYQVQQGMKIVSSEYQGHMKVTESGELLYYFPAGMRNTVKGFIPAFKRFWQVFSTGLLKVLSFLFKIWIMVMLVGYFILFVVILVAALVAAIAAATAGKGRSRKGGGFYLVMKVFQLFARIWFWGAVLDNRSNYPRNQRPKKSGRPLHKSVFGYVFGDGDPNAGWEKYEKKLVLAYLQTHRGVITLEELMTLTGRDFDTAQQLINRYLLEFEGSPEVTERGTLIYFFPELLRTTDRPSSTVSLQSANKKRLIAFSKNETKTNGWLSFFNVFNILFSAYFAGHVLLAPVYGVGPRIPFDFAFVYHFVYGFLQNILADPNTLILAVLGVVPLLFSFFFFLVPLLRNIKRKQENNLIKEENLRKKTYAYLISNPIQADPRQILPSGEDETPKKAIKIKQKIFDLFAAEKQADIEAASDGAMLYTFKEFEAELRDVESHRSKINLKDFAVGETVFDSGE